MPSAGRMACQCAAGGSSAGASAKWGSRRDGGRGGGSPRPSRTASAAGARAGARRGADSSPPASWPAGADAACVDVAGGPEEPATSAVRGAVGSSASRSSSAASACARCPAPADRPVDRFDKRNPGREAGRPPRGRAITGRDGARAPKSARLALGVRRGGRPRETPARDAATRRHVEAFDGTSGRDRLGARKDEPREWTVGRRHRPVGTDLACGKRRRLDGVVARPDEACAVVVAGERTLEELRASHRRYAQRQQRPAEQRQPGPSRSPDPAGGVEHRMRRLNDRGHGGSVSWRRAGYSASRRSSAHKAAPNARETARRRGTPWTPTGCHRATT